MLTVDLVFYLGMASHEIGTERPSNMIDVAYLYYLPFCMVFVSGDKLHARLAPLLLRPDQRFVMAADLKAGLKTLNEHYAQYRGEIEREGIVRFAPEPPAEVRTIVTDLWDELLLPRGRVTAESEVGPEDAKQAPSNDDLLRMIEQIRESDEHVPEAEQIGQADSVITEHRVPVRRGSWRLFPEGAENWGH